jgi:hypothetical protein
MDLATTQRYMHVSPAAIEGATRCLIRPFRLKADTTIAVVEEYWRRRENHKNQSLNRLESLKN